MTINTKQNLLDELAKGDAMYGWGAMFAVGRDHFNQLLQTQFVDAFATQDFVLPVTGEYYVDNHTEKVVFENLMFGPPQLSFKQASGRTPHVTVSMEMIAGTCSMIAQHPGTPNWLRRSHLLQQGMGYQFEVTAELKVVRVPYSDQGQLFIDWSTAAQPTCNLAVTDSARRDMGNYIKQQLEQFWHAWRLPVVTVEYHAGYNAMSVVDFTVVAQKAPEGAGSGSSPSDDGAVVLLMQLRGSKRWGNLPGELLYLLPSKDAGGGNYGAALLVNKAWAPMLRELAEDLLSQVVLPQAYQNAMTEEHRPHDAILFGDIEPTQETRALQPALSSVGAFSQENFSLAGGPASAWSVRNLTYPRACGVIDKGRYTASAINEFASDQQVVVVTAKLSDAADSKVRTALMVESSEALAISPRVVLWGKGDNPVRLKASHSEGVTWTLEGGNHGDLHQDPDDPRYTLFVPGDQNGAAQVVLQRVKATRGAESGYATVVILNYSPALAVEPFHVARMPPSGTQAFTLADYPGEGNWVLFGAGEVDAATGLYTAPDAEAGEVSVVAGVFGNSAGLAVIEHQRNSVRQMATRQERWRSLNKFEVSRNNVNRNRVLANGMQQVGIDILIETNEFEGEDGKVWDPVSDLELSTLVLLHEDGTEVEFLPPGAEGLNPDDAGGKKWAVSKFRNRFDYLPTGGLQAEQSPLLALVDARRTVTLYVNALEAEVRKFKAKFQDHRNGWHFSDVVDKTKGVVELEGVQVPPPNLGNYTFTSRRVFADKGSDHGQPVDTFNYWHYTTHYWVLMVKDTQFASVHFDHASMIRWESERAWETYCTYTGMAFKPRRHPDAVPPPVGITYGAELELLAHDDKMRFTGLDYAFKGQEGVSEGALLLSLDRVPNMNYWLDSEFARYREVLDRPLVFTLIDSYGIAHRLKITFGEAGADSRNSMALQLQ